MNYLTQEIQRRTCAMCGKTEDLHVGFEHDDATGLIACRDCDYSEGHSALPRSARWWSVAIYETHRAYGGPEEGGWFYDCGEWVMRSKTRVFEDYDQAVAYQAALREWLRAEGCSADLWVRGYTEQMPPAYFPSRRPRYC
jgi:hypothetical protein